MDEVGPPEVAEQPSRWQFRVKLTKIWVYLGGFLAIVGLCNLVDTLVVWVGFFRNVLDVYQGYIRGPIVRAVDWVLPDFIPPIPWWGFDVFVIWTASYAVMRAFVYFENEGPNARSPLHMQFLVFLVGPVFPLAFLLSLPVTRWSIGFFTRRYESLAYPESADAERKRIFVEKNLERAKRTFAETKDILYRMGKYYLAAIGIFTVILYINYQISMLP